MKKLCKKCKQLLSVNLFELRKDSGTLRGNCKNCEKERKKAEYNRNIKAYAVRSAKQRKERRLKINQILEEVKSVPCKDCSKTFPSYVMDLDHVTGEKIGDMNYFKRYGYVKQLIEEIKKCEVVCANCHRIRTHKRNQYI